MIHSLAAEVIAKLKAEAGDSESGLLPDIFAIGSYIMLIARFSLSCFFVLRPMYLFGRERR